MINPKVNDRVEITYSADYKDIGKLATITRLHSGEFVRLRLDDNDRPMYIHRDWLRKL